MKVSFQSKSFLTAKLCLCFALCVLSTAGKASASPQKVGSYIDAPELTVDPYASRSHDSYPQVLLAGKRVIYAGDKHKFWITDPEQGETHALINRGGMTNRLDQDGNPEPTMTEVNLAASLETVVASSLTYRCHTPESGGCHYFVSKASLSAAGNSSFPPRFTTLSVPRCPGYESKLYDDLGHLGHLNRIDLTSGSLFAAVACDVLYEVDSASKKSRPAYSFTSEQEAHGRIYGLSHSDVNRIYFLHSAGKYMAFRVDMGNSNKGKPLGSKILIYGIESKKIEYSMEANSAIPVALQADGKLVVAEVNDKSRVVQNRCAKQGNVSLYWVSPSDPVKHSVNLRGIKFSQPGVEHSRYSTVLDGDPVFQNCYAYKTRIFGNRIVTARDRAGGGVELVVSDLSGQSTRSLAQFSSTKELADWDAKDGYLAFARVGCSHTDVYFQSVDDNDPVPAPTAQLDCPITLSKQVAKLIFQHKGKSTLQIPFSCPKGCRPSMGFKNYSSAKKQLPASVKAGQSGKATFRFSRAETRSLKKQLAKRRSQIFTIRDLSSAKENRIKLKLSY